VIIGVPKEIKNNENRVGITPAGVQMLIRAGHEVFIETRAGEGSGFSDGEYQSAGASILETAEEVYARADMIMKVKEPLPAEYGLLKKDQIVFTYLHLAPEPRLTKALLDAQVVGIAYETIRLDDGSLPLLTPMSEVAGRMAVQIGAWYLQRPNGGVGVLLGGVPGVPPANVTIIGGGVVGTNAAKIALGMGAKVTLLDTNIERLRYLDDIFGQRIVTLVSNSYNIAAAVKDADLLIGAVLIPGARAPKLVTEEMVKTMKPRSVIVDVAIDQGGSVETITHATTHSDPVYVKHGVVHYSVANMPGAVPRTSTIALTNATMKYALDIANKGWKKACMDDPALARGVNVLKGHVTCQPVAECQGYEYVPLENLLQA